MYNLDMLNIRPADRTPANVFISSLTQVMDTVEIHKVNKY